MLSNKRLTILADTVVDNAKIASYVAVLDLEDMDLSLSSRHIDNNACKVHKDIVRKDNKDFEDYAYALQDKLMASEIKEPKGD